MTNVIELGPHPRMSPQDVLSLTAREEPIGLIILYLGQDGNYYQRASQMDKKEALLMIDAIRETVDV